MKTKQEPRFLTLLDIRALNEIQIDNRPVYQQIFFFWDRPRKLWEVQKDLVFYSRILDTVIRVERHFVTDLASVPRLPIVYMMVGEIAQEAAVIHDYLYQKHSINGQPITKRQADLVLYEAMGACQYPVWQKEAMYGGVFVGGFSSWNSGPQRFTLLGNNKPE